MSKEWGGKNEISGKYTPLKKFTGKDFSLTFSV